MEKGRCFRVIKGAEVRRDDSVDFLRAGIRSTS